MRLSIRLLAVVSISVSMLPTMDRVEGREGGEEVSDMRDWERLGHSGDEDCHDRKEPTSTLTP